MLDPKWIRECPDEVRDLLKRRHHPFDLDALLDTESERRSVMSKTEELKARRNEGSKKVGQLKKSGGDASALMEEMRLIGDEIGELDARLSDIEERYKKQLQMMPNKLDSSVPTGDDETANVELRRWGEPKSFSFEPRPHWELADALGMMDFERGARLAESRFTVLRHNGARLHRALADLMLDMHTREHGYVEINPPVMVNSNTMLGTGQLPKFADELYKIDTDDLWMIPTAEVPLTNMHYGEILRADQLPLKYTAHTLCFRREAGTYGRDMRGIIRQHQFEKVELVEICRPEESYDELESLLASAEAVMRALELPYRVMLLSSGDIGDGSCKTYDIEVWLPSQGCYREISSCSNCEDFQARRMSTRYRDVDGKIKLVHTLNGSGVAIGRCLVAVMENYQNEDGSITVPKALRPYLGGMEKISV